LFYWIFFYFYQPHNFQGFELWDDKLFDEELILQTTYWMRGFSNIAISNSRKLGVIKSTHPIRRAFDK